MSDLSVLIAPDSFKGSASSREVGELIEQGVRRVVPGASVRRFPIADGGEGTVEAIVSACDGELREVRVSGPLGDLVVARYGMVGGTCAVIEMAEASGITLIEQTSENARRASELARGRPGHPGRHRQRRREGADRARRLGHERRRRGYGQGAGGAFSRC